MSPTRLANGKFEERIVVNGKRVRRRFDTAAQAAKFRKALKLDKSLREFGLPGIARTSRPTLVSILDDFERAAAERDVAPATQDYYSTCLAGLRAFVKLELRTPDLLADQLDDELVRRYVAWRVGRKLGKSRVEASAVQAGKDLTILRMVYRHAHVEPRWARPARLPAHRGGKRVLTPEELAAFLAALPAGTLARTYAEVAAGTGMRGCDIRKLRWSEVDIPGRVIAFTAQKTGRELAVPMAEVVAAALLTWRDSPARTIDDTDRVFVVPARGELPARGLHKDTLRKTWLTASKAAEITPPIEALGLTRNTVASMLLSRGENAYLVSVLLGHADLRTTLEYARKHRPTDELRALVQKLATGPEMAQPSGKS